MSNPATTYTTANQQRLGQLVVNARFLLRMLEVTDFHFPISEFQCTHAYQLAGVAREIENLLGANDPVTA